MQITLMCFVTLCIDVHKNFAFLMAKSWHFDVKKPDFNAILMSYDK